jgi:hypothetical protein
VAASFASEPGEACSERKFGNQYCGFRRFSRVAIEASFGGQLVNSEIARASAILEIARLGAVKSPSSKPRQTAL